MEDHVRKLVEKEKKELDELNQKRLIKEKSLKEEIQLRDIRKNIEELEKEEETLKVELEKVRKKNFSLNASINAWQSVRKSKLDEFKQAQLKLNELYQEIWKGREEFCSKADDFNNEFGILSDWWKTQMEYVNDVQNVAKERVEEKKHQEDIEQLQKAIADLKKEIETLSREQETQQQQQQQQHKKEDSSITGVINKTQTRLPFQEQDTKYFAFKETIPTNKTIREDDETNSRGKKVKFSEKEDIMEVNSEEIITPNNELYSLMDINKMRMANRNKKAFRNKFRKLLN